MVDSQLREELVQQLGNLSLPLQKKVLEYARSLASPPSLRGIPGSELVKFAGTVTPEDCEAMMEAIEAGCEQIDPNEW
jgi:hypothetical protein